MKRMMLTALLTGFGLWAAAQNVQLHYDLGHSLNSDLSGRPSVTTTIEMFRPDGWGSTYFFVDIDYFHDGVAGAYWEISREMNITKNKQWAIHAEYDGGTASSQLNDMSTRFQHALLGGAAWNWASSDYRRTFSLQALYKYYFKGQHAWNRAFSSFQATAVWGITTANRLLTFSGFVDVWYDKSVKGNWILLSEPQFWWNLSAMKGMEKVPISIGTEVELSNNFVFDKYGRNDRFHAIPTLAAKWTF